MKVKKAILMVIMTATIWSHAVSAEGYKTPFFEGWRGISLPFAPDDASPGTGLGVDNPQIFGYASGSYVAASAGLVLEAGKGYFMKFDPAAKITATGTATPVGSLFEIPLEKGWNLIGNPFADEVEWVSVTVDGESASGSGKVSEVAYGYDEVSGMYYEAAELEPWRAYWVWASGSCAGCKLEINPSTGKLEGYAYAPVGSGERSAGRNVERYVATAPVGFKAVSEASVSVTCGTYERATTTDYSGYYGVSGLPAGSCVVRAEKSGYAAAQSDETINAGEAMEAKNLLLYPEESGSVKVSANVGGGEIFIDGDYAGVKMPEALNYTLENVSAGVREVAVLLEGYGGGEGATVTVTNGVTAEITFTLAPSANAAPVANAGEDANWFSGVRYVWEGDVNYQAIFSQHDITYELDGSVSADPDGDPLAYSWTQLAGPAAEVESPSASRTEFIPTETGDYVFELKVSDGSLQSTDEVMIHIEKITGKVAISMPTGSTGLAIVSIDFNKKEMKQLTEGVKLNSMARWSPDGSKILYSCEQDGAEKPSVCEMNYDGTEQTVLQPGFSYGRGECYSPDGEYIYFHGKVGNKYEIFRMSASTATAPVQITSLGYADIGRLFYSRKSDRIVFDVAYNNATAFARDIHVLDLNNNQVSRLTSNGLANWFSRWTNDDRIIYSNFDDWGEPYVTHIMNDDGTEVEEYAPLSGVEALYLTFTPDERFILYADKNNSMSLHVRYMDGSAGVSIGLPAFSIDYYGGQ